MIFVTDKNGYQLLAQRDLTRKVPSSRGDDSGWDTVVVRPQVMIQFQSPGHLTYQQRKAALDFFDSRETGEDGMPPGAYRYGSVASDPDFEGMVYNGSDHWLMFSVFDTEKDCPWIEEMDAADVKALCEKTLLECKQFGHDYIRIDEVKAPAPWPNFDETHHKQIPLVTKALKLDPRVVIAYLEENDMATPGLVGELERLVELKQAEQAALEDLTVRG